MMLKDGEREKLEKAQKGLIEIIEKLLYVPPQSKLGKFIEDMKALLFVAGVIAYLATFILFLFVWPVGALIMAIIVMFIT